MSTLRTDLTAIRQQIDSIDDQMLDLLRQRVQLVEQVAAVKAQGGVALTGRDVVRPAREAQILRRLFAQADPLIPRRLIIGIWRELIGALSLLQGPLRAVVYEPDLAVGAFRAIARDHYGNATPAKLLASSAAAVRAVADGAATVAVVPPPHEGERAPWWPMLMGPEGRTPRVVNRLPFYRVPGEPEAFALSLATPEATGDDQSLVAVELLGDMSRGRLYDAFRAAGMVPLSSQVAPGPDGAEMVLLEVEGFVAANDARLHLVTEHTGPAVARILAVGAYPMPYSGK
jgi:chorismate mutase / prephenate dehydratase